MVIILTRNWGVRFMCHLKVFKLARTKITNKSDYLLLTGYNATFGVLLGNELFSRLDFDNEKEYFYFFCNQVCSDAGCLFFAYDSFLSEA